MIPVAGTYLRPNRAIDREDHVAKNSIIRLIQSVAILASAVALSAALANAQDAGALYKTKCAACHGADGNPSATGKMMGAQPFSAPEVAKESDSDLTQAIAHGKNKMPAYGKTLKDSDIKELVSYIHELQKKKS